MNPDDIDAAPGGLLPSKSERKRAMHALQELGAALAALAPARLAALELPERLRDALAEWQRTRSHEGRRRQLQYIGRLMRSVDPGPIRAALDAQRHGSAAQTLRLHRLEGERLALLAAEPAGSAAATRWIGAHPDADGERLHRLVRAARRDQAEHPEMRSGRAYRELFQFLQRHDSD